ncbi:MAG: ABC transporter transmembrane domain-containing protein [bacterium]
MLFLDFQLALVALFPAVLVLIITLLLSPWVKRKNLESLQTIGGVSSDIQESLSNFKVILAFNRLDYFRQKFRESNEKNYKTSI